ncbi:MerR family transcriptional regulator [Clostridium sp. AM58-1XD]|uniref:MerR family transcriptional regulator n=1 Tax=Clostridium sp. AM58-1XD TaxID=2292307 RepID=UPI000E4B38B6|nr:MerR family transcriptional regulator [Clostridium sp. AM58-1XD]RGY96011.1 MerR family transcriptional regulator [Clostridium sp. AM58-1XD]
MEQKTEREQEYLIGDVARIVGLSRDALRFYEKKGVIRTQKKENGYRYYSENDIYKLMHILYRRKMNSSLKEIEETMVMDRENTVRHMKEYLHSCMEKEREELKNHKRMIARMKLLERDMRNIEEHLDRITLRRFPAAYIVDECHDLQEGLKNWFQLAALKDGMDMMYFYTELSLKKSAQKVVNTRLLLYKNLEKVLTDGFDLSCLKETGEMGCIHTVVETEELLPESRIIRMMEEWGCKHGLKTEERVYVNHMTSFSLKESPTYCLELYMPVSGATFPAALEI